MCEFPFLREANIFLIVVVRYWINMEENLNEIAEIKGWVHILTGMLLLSTCRLELQGLPFTLGIPSWGIRVP